MTNKVKVLIKKFQFFFMIGRDQRQAKNLLKRRRYPKLPGQILVEANQPAWNQLALSCFLPIASEFFDATPINYYLQKQTFFISIKQKLRQIFSVARCYGIYTFKILGPSNKQLKLNLFEASNYAQYFKSKRALELFEYKGIRIGDLVYDQYLRAAGKPTVDFSDPLFILKLAEGLSFVDSTVRYFDKNIVKAVCVSHTVYSLAIPARVAIKREIAAFQVNGESIYRLSSSNSHAYADFKFYRSKFKKLDSSLRQNGIAEAKTRLDRRLSGEVGVDMLYSTASAYSNKNYNNFELKKTGKISILVAVHDFFDSPHSYGDNLFPDFLEWLEFLVEISSETDYEWYVKTHPDVVGNSEEVLKELVSRNKNFTLVPKEVSHHQLIKEGISVVLTVFGTIAAEYAYLGKLALNASINNPHIAYEFCLNPKTVEEYKAIIFNLPSLIESFKPDTQQILEFYFMHNIYKQKTWMLQDLDHALQVLGGYSRLLDWRIVPYFFESENSTRLMDIPSSIKRFLESGDFVFGREHFSQ